MNILYSVKGRWAYDEHVKVYEGRQVCRRMGGRQENEGSKKCLQQELVSYL